MGLGTNHLRIRWLLDDVRCGWCCGCRFVDGLVKLGFLVGSVWMPRLEMFGQK